MINFNEVKIGDYLMGEYEGKMWEGEVTRLNGDEKQVCVETEVQPFWFEPLHLYPIPINDENLLKLNFTKEEMPDGSVKYKKGAFRIVIAKKDDFSNIEIWYREDIRFYSDLRYIHQLQNHYLQMTKIHLTKDVMV
ncbi:MAG: hypothetical protein ACR2FN_13020 [Chitinophagaceae bacterium]